MAKLITADGKNVSGTNPLPVAPAPVTITATIPANQTTSGAVDLKGASLVMIHMPGAWTAADIKFLSAPTETGTYQPVFDDVDVEIVAKAAAGRAIAIRSGALALAQCRFLKFVSTVNQAAARDLILSVK